MVAKELSKYKLDFVGVPEARWDRGGTKTAQNCTFPYGKRNENHKSFGHKSSTSVVS
jgi:hypothetical protein